MKKNVSHFIALSFAVIYFFPSCSKPDNSPAPGGGGGTPGFLTPFTVTVTERIPDRAIISWTACINTINADAVYYKVTLNGQLVHTGLTQTKDTLNNLVSTSAYQGQVIAYISNGTSIAADFILQKIDGVLVMGRNDGTSEVVESFDIYTGVRLWRTLTGTFSNSSYYGTPTISNDTVFITKSKTSDFSLFALNVKTGAFLWKGIPSAGSNYISDVAYYNGKLYTVLDGKLLCINSKNGQVLWTYQGSTDFELAPSVRNGKVYVGYYYNGGGTVLHVLNAETGAIIWQYTYQGLYQGHAIVNNGTLYFVTSAAVYAFKESDGTLLWRRNSDAGFQCAQSPVIYNNEQIITGGAENFGFYGINKNNGTTIWNTTSAGSSFPITLDGSTLYFAQYYFGFPGELKAMKANTGQIIWTRSNLDARSPVAVNNRLYAYQNSRSRVVVYDGLTGGAMLEIGPSYYFNESGFVIIINDKPYYPSRHPDYN